MMHACDWDFQEAIMMDVEEEEDDGVGNQVKIPTLPAPDSLSSSSLCFITLFSYNLRDSDVVWLQIVTFRRYVSPTRNSHCAGRHQIASLRFPPKRSNIYHSAIRRDPEIDNVIFQRFKAVRL
ncbi:unnamed protein product [Armillaria ostoyae]|uniref:Uncharacterized protein n=1 Tax=Armillaria ostoyae TaxID=47428 RepID=A0A284R1B5_ARMOS|nr:unnamed protein product [Armillaria ostoyae]